MYCGEGGGEGLCLGGRGAHMCCAIGTYPGAEDIISSTDSSVQTGKRALPSTVVNLNTKGDIGESRQCITGGWGMCLKGGNAHVCYAIATYQVAEDTITTDSSVQAKESGSNIHCREPQYRR